MKILLLCLEKPENFPYSPAVEVMQSAVAQSELNCVGEVLDFQFAKAAEAARAVVERESPDLVVILSNALSNMEFVLYRYAHNQWTPGLEDNHGQLSPDGRILADGPGALIGTAALMGLFGAWQSAQQGQYSHVTFGLGSDGGLENAIYYELLTEFHGKKRPAIGHIGVPPFAEEHDIVKPEYLKNTLVFLLSELAKLST